MYHERDRQPGPSGLVPWRMAGNMLFLSAVGPRLPKGAEAVRKIGQALTVRQGQDRETPRPGVDRQHARRSGQSQSG